MNKYFKAVLLFAIAFMCMFMAHRELYFISPYLIHAAAGITMIIACGVMLYRAFELLTYKQQPKKADLTDLLALRMALLDVKTKMALKGDDLIADELERIYKKVYTQVFGKEIEE